MEVLLSSSPPTPPVQGPSSSYSHYQSSSSHHRSLLDRRLGPGESSTLLNISHEHILVSSSNNDSSKGYHPSPHRRPPLSTLPARSPRKPPATSALSFTPLTPILSPPLTPASTSLASISSFTSPSREIHSAELTTTTISSSTNESPAEQDEDYLNKGRPSASVSVPANLSLVPPEVKLSPTDLRPSWIATPPTPPPKPEPGHDRTPEPPVLINRPRHRRTGAQPRPLSLAPRSSPSININVNAQRDVGGLTGPRRRASLPAMSLLKPLPPVPPPLPSPTTKPEFRNGQFFASLPKDAPVSPAAVEDDILSITSRRARSQKSMFHIEPPEPDGNSDNEDDDPEDDHGRSRGWVSGVTSGSGSVVVGTGSERTASEERWERVKVGDDVRRYHALMELLATEVGYLVDLRVLISIYLQQLPTVAARPPLSPHFSRPSPSPSFMSTTFNGGHGSGSSHSRSNSHTQGQIAAPAPTGIPSSASSPQQHPVGVNTNHPHPSAGRETNASSKQSQAQARAGCVFSEEELRTVRRNAGELLEFHERFVADLRALVDPFGLRMEGRGDGQEEGKCEIDEAVSGVASMFCDKAPLFNVYEPFCSRHPEAIDLVRKVQQQHSLEWDAFEQRCSVLIAGMQDEPEARSPSESNRKSSPPVAYTEPEGLDHAQTEEERARASESLARKRRHSTSSIGSIGRSLGSHLRSNTHINMGQQSKSDQDSKGSKSQSARLNFMDYLIKPVQRICKYPLLLDQLKTAKAVHGREPSSSSSGRYVEADASVESAGRAIRAVVSSVDEARRRRDVTLKSSIIASRIVATPPSSSASSSNSSQNLTPEFMASLGVCLMAGSFDVMYYHAVDALLGTDTIKVKYLGAFLYMGGYMVLVKVGKGKSYEPRHWFWLAGFEVVDVHEDDAVIPCSIRLSRREHCFELAASCQREKDLWLSAIRQSLSANPSWANEPACSLQETATVDGHAQTDDGHSASWCGRRPSVDYSDRADCSNSGADHNLKSDGITRKDTLPGSLASTSRRSSTTSVKALFSPVSANSTMLIRSTLPLRQHVDRGLLDIFSEACLSARFQAQTHDEDLFPAPRASVSRASAMAGVMGARNRLSKRESVLVPRRKSLLDGFEMEAEANASSASKRSVGRTKSLASRRQIKRSLRIMPTLPNGGSGTESDARVNEDEPLADSPLPLSQCSSGSVSHGGGSSAPSPSYMVDLARSRHNSAVPSSAKTQLRSNDGEQSEFLAVVSPEFRPKRTRSMVDNVRGLFHPRSTSPAPSITLDSSRLHPNDEEWIQQTHPKRLSRWWKGSLRRRVQSAPDAPTEDSDPDPANPEKVDIAKDVARSAPHQLEGLPSIHQLDDAEASLPASDSKTGLKPHPSTPLGRRSSLFSAFPNKSRRDMNPAIPSSPSRKSGKNVSFLQRLHPASSSSPASSDPYV